jgi:hypothetical protein
MTLLKELPKVKARRQNSSWIEISLIFIFAFRSRFLFRLLHLVEVIFMEGKRHQLTSVAPCEGAGSRIWHDLLLQGRLVVLSALFWLFPRNWLMSFVLIVKFLLDKFAIFIRKCLRVLLNVVKFFEIARFYIAYRLWKFVFFETFFLIFNGSLAWSMRLLLLKKGLDISVFFLF